MINQQQIPQRKPSSHGKYDQQKQMFSNTNVLTGISQAAMTPSYRPKNLDSKGNFHKSHPSNPAIVYSTASSSEQLKKVQHGYNTVSDHALGPNTKITNTHAANGYQQSAGFNSTAPIKFSGTTERHAYQENLHQYIDRTSYQTKDISPARGYESAKPSNESSSTLLNGQSNRIPASSLSKTAMGSQRQQSVQPHQSGSSKSNQNYTYQHQIAAQIQKQGSSNNLRNKYNRNPVVQTQSQGRTSSNAGSKQSSSHNLLNKTQQQVSSQVLTQANAQYKQGYHQRRESGNLQVKEKVAPHASNSSSRNGGKSAQIKTSETPTSSNNTHIIQAHKATLNEYKVFMEKQKQMLKQLSSNKLAQMLNALNTTPNEIQQQIQTKKAQQTTSNIQSPKRAEPQVKVQPKLQAATATQHTDSSKENVNLTAKIELAKTPRTLIAQQPQEAKPLAVQLAEEQASKPKIVQPMNTVLTPRTVQPPAAKADQEKPPEAKQTPTDPNQESNPNDDSMCFSKKSSLEEYIIGKQIGQGAYAVVRIGLHKPSNKKVAMKIYKKYKLLDPNRRKSVKREIKLMEKMKHPHIIRLYEVIDTSKYVILVMEYVGGGSLHGYLKSKGNRRLDEPEAKRIFSQVLDGIKYCHSRCITHRDIKLENLLLDDMNNIKIIDFGFSTCIPNDKKIKIFCGTPSYMAPEIVQKLEYAGPPADIWALGVLLFTILSGCFPYRGATDKELYKKIMRADYKLPPEVQSSLSPEAVNLLRRLFAIDANKRPSAREIMHDPWLQEQSQSKVVRSLSSQPVPSTSTTTYSQINQYKKSNTDVAQESEPAYSSPYQRCSSQQPGKDQAQPGQYNPYFSNTQASNQTQSSLNNTAQYQESNQALQGSAAINGQALQNSARHSYLNSGVGAQNIMAGGNTINNNFNIINNIMQVNCDKQMPSTPTTHSNLGQRVADENQAQEDLIIQIIVTKLGYTPDEVRRYVKDESSFVSVLYHKILEEQSAKMTASASRCNNSLSAKSNIQPSFIASIASSLNHSNISSSNAFNNTQPSPFTQHLERSRDPSASHLNNQGYYGSFHDSQSHLSQTMGSSFISNSFASGHQRKDQPTMRNRDHSNQPQYEMMLSSDDEPGSNRHSHLNHSGVNYNLNATQTNLNLTAMLNSSSMGGVYSNQDEQSYHLNNSGYVNNGQTPTHIKKSSAGPSDFSHIIGSSQARRQPNGGQPVSNNLISKNLQWRREFI